VFLGVFRDTYQKHYKSITDIDRDNIIKYNITYKNLKEEKENESNKRFKQKK